jgi:hypothetical protein
MRGCSMMIFEKILLVMELKILESPFKNENKKAIPEKVIIS